MKAKDLTPLQRIMILEDVLKKLESGDAEYGLCTKIENSAYKLFKIWAKANKIIPIFTLENAKKVTKVASYASEGGYWWDYSDSYDLENRIKFVKWMIEMEKSLLNK